MPKPRVKTAPTDAEKRRLWAEHIAALVARGRHQVPPLNWRDRAACADNTHPDLWVPFSRQAGVNAEAARVCDWCPARTDCLVAALLDPSELGVRAGLNESTVNRLRTRLGTTDQ
ncbi:WhiB family transcriptional regulator [Streptomonospora wellingtoniae]|uniref:WhiB family transcriptional regulator n=1 Tax=Streptomonospora wellingtoniae TaxID=3075544 RepID=A0ABU2L0M2_9ACTN|nr:WhiB family transcriptional regulator [Streptomonospora sp. DSM 45055]MDT0305088.1 WhiB family transcriptional regulator [Streptomonospora sp. DSM 45055]